MCKILELGVEHLICLQMVFFNGCPKMVENSYDVWVIYRTIYVVLL